MTSAPTSKFIYLYNIEKVSTAINIYIFTAVIITYLLRPYKFDKYYVVTEYINNNSAVRNILALPTTFKFLR